MEDVGILSSVLENMLVIISSGFARLSAYAKPLFYQLLTFQILLLGLAVALNKADAISGFTKIVFKANFYLFVIANMPALNDVILRTASELGFIFGGQTNLGWMFKDPSAIADYGIQAVQPLLDWINSMGMYQVACQYPSVLATMVVIVCILCAYFYLSFQVFMTLIDFYLCTASIAIFLCFRVFSITAWMSDGAVKGFFTHAVKIFVLCIILSIIQPMVEGFTQINRSGIQAEYVFSVLLSSLLIWLLSMKAGSWAQALTSGAPSMGAGDLVKAAASATAGFAAGALGGAGLLKAGAMAMQKATGISAQGALKAGVGMASGMDKAKGAASGLKNMAQGYSGFKDQLKASMQKSSAGSSGQSSARPSSGAIKTLTKSFKNSYNTSKKIHEVGQNLGDI